jgi:hypothetical protein
MPFALTVGAELVVDTEKLIVKSAFLKNLPMSLAASGNKSPLPPYNLLMMQ